MSKSSKRQFYNEPKTIIQKIIDRKREELLVNIATDISDNRVVDISNNIQPEPTLEPVIDFALVNKTNDLLLNQKVELLQKIRKNCIQLNLTKK